jgi:ABC-type multidrug transport system fused ATPase/permease subunit
MKDLKRFLSYMGKYSFTYWFILIATLIIESFLQILYSYVTKRTINAIEFQNIELFRTAVIASVIIVILKCLFPYLRYFQIRLVRKMVYELKLKLYEKLLSMNMDFFKSTHSADAIKTLNWDANSLKDSWFSHIYWVLGKMVMVVSAIITMCFYSPILMGISLIICAFTAFVSVKINKSIKKYAKMVQKKSTKLSILLSNIISGFVTLKMSSGARIVLNHFYEESEEAFQLEKSRVMVEASFEMVAFLLGVIGSFGTIIAGTVLVSEGTLDFGTVMAVVTLQMSVSNAMQRLGGSISALTTSIVRASHVFDFMELDMEEQINRLTGENPGKEVFKGESSDVFGKGQPVLEISDLQFSYNDNDKLKDKSKDCAELCCGKMQIRAGEKIMLTGESGCGKSTLLKLIQGFYPVENEKITIGGKDINEYELDELRNIIAYVPQDSYLFEGTIAENIAFGWNGENVPSMDMIIVAAKEAYADKFIEHLPDGYNTKVTVGGTNLSGGQRQRIAIARAFMKNSPIVLMDEPSSALDTYSENVLLKAMKELLENKTVIMVSHRMTGMDKFERVVRIG